MKRGTKTLEKVDFRKTHPELYRATRGVSQVKIGRAAFLAVDGVGDPGAAQFQEAVGRIFALAYTTKFTLKAAGKVDFAVPALECLWFDDPADKPRDQWRWRLLVRIPDQVAARDLLPIRKRLVEKKRLDTSSVKRLTWAEGLAVQMLHVGPYKKLGASYQELAVAASQRGLECAGPAHEIYLSDPRRVAPGKLKTIVRLGARRAPAR